MLWKALGLSRDPFAPVADGPLYWETPERARAREQAVEALAAGRSVFLRGPAGSGRETLVARIVDEAAARGRAVLYVVPDGGEQGFLAAALECAGEDPEGLGLERAARLYGRLLAVLCERGTPVVAVGWPAEDDDTRAEFGILGELRVVGRPLAAVLCFGAGEPCPAGAEVIPVPAPTEADLRDLVAHRLAACGGAHLLDPALLDAVARRARGMGHAVRLARRHLVALAFGGAVPGPEPGRAAPGRVLDPGAVSEAEGLLSSLGPDRSPEDPESF